MQLHPLRPSKGNCRHSTAGKKQFQLELSKKIAGLQFGINGLCGWLVSYFWNNPVVAIFLASAFSVFLWILNQQTIKQQQSGVKQTLLRVKMLRVEVNEVNISFCQKPPQISHSNLRRIKKTSSKHCKSHLLLNYFKSQWSSFLSILRSNSIFKMIRVASCGLRQLRRRAPLCIFLDVKWAHYRNALGLRRWCGGSWEGCLDPWMEAASSLWMPGRDESRPTMCE